MEPAVHELVHGLEAEVVEGLELAYAGEVEQSVAVQLPRNRPERNAERDPSGRDSEDERRRPPQRSHNGERESDRSYPRVERERPPQRALDREHHRRRRRQPREAPRERREHAPPSKRSCDERTGHEQSGDEPDVEAGAGLREYVSESERGQRQELPGPTRG